MAFRVSDWQELEFPLPPLPEQKKIAAILASVDEAIEATEAVIEQTRRVKKGLLEELLTQGIGHTSFKETKIGEIPEAWELAEIQDMCSKVSVGIASGVSHAYAESGVPLIRNKDIIDGRIDTSELLHVTPELDEQYSTKRLHAGDVITMRTGEPGRSAVVPDEFDRCQSFTTLISRPIRERMLGEFMAQWLNSSQGLRQVRRFQGGGAQHNLNVSDMRQIKIAVPPISEQQAIVSRFRALDEVITENEAQVDRLEEVKKGLLQDLLTGEVRVDIEEAEDAVEEAKETAEAMAE